MSLYPFCVAFCCVVLSERNNNDNNNNNALPFAFRPTKSCCSMLYFLCTVYFKRIVYSVEREILPRHTLIFFLSLFKMSTVAYLCVACTAIAASCSSSSRY